MARMKTLGISKNTKIASENGMTLYLLILPGKLLANVFIKKYFRPMVSYYLCLLPFTIYIIPIKN